MLEARTVGFCATGNTTAKMSLLQGATLSKIIGRHGVETAKAYVEGNREGQERLIHHCRANGATVQRENATPTRRPARSLAR